MEQRVEGELGPAIDAAYKAHKALTGLRSRMLGPIADARGIVVRKVTAYQDEQRRIAEAERARAEAALRRQEEERRRAEAAEVERLAKVQREELAAQAKAAREAGDAAAAKALREEAKAVKAEAAAEAEAIRSEPIVAPMVHVAPQVAEVKGVSTKSTWSAEVTDKAALIRHVAARLDSDPGIASLLDPAMPALNRLAVSQRAELRVGGVRAVEKRGISIRTGASA